MTSRTEAKLRLALAAIIALFLADWGDHSRAGQPALAEAATIPLPGTRGRVDHLALDLAHCRLYVAEIANGTVDVVDLEARRVAGRISDLAEPQGLAFLPAADELVVACGGGSVRFYDGTTLRLKATVGGLDDADNVRIDPVSGDVVVSHGSGALAVIDPVRHAVKATVALPSHPEGFQLAEDGRKAYVNLPRSLSIAVVDMPGHKVLASWPARAALENFPMALDEADNVVLAGFRLPGRFLAFDLRSGKVIASRPACGQVDDLFYDSRRARAYMLCGDGHIDVFSRSDGWKRMAEVATPRGGRTGLYSPDLDELFVVSSGESSATLTILKPI